MPYKWMPLIEAAMAATPTYLLWHGDNLGAAIKFSGALRKCSILTRHEPRIDEHFTPSSTVFGRRR